MKEKIINELRSSARKLIRELGILKLNMVHNRAPQHWHALIEIANEPNITISKLQHLFFLTTSSISRIVKSLISEGLVLSSDGMDKREKHLNITAKGLREIRYIDEFSRVKIKGALEFLSEMDQIQIVHAINKYSNALEKDRLSREQIKIHKLSTSRPLRRQIISMIEKIQKNEFALPITEEMNMGILKAENEFYFNNSYNFWYSTNDRGEIIGSIGLKKIDNKNGEIKKFFVHHKYRGKGVSQKLLNTLTKSASKHHLTHLYLGTVDTLYAAHRFYEKFGFSKMAGKDLPKKFSKSPLDKIFYKIELDALQEALVKQV